MSLPDADFIMAMLKNKDQVATQLLKDLETSQQNAEAFQKLEKLFEEGKQIEPQQVMKASAKTLRHMNQLNQRLLVLLLVYMQGSHYTSDTVTFLNKLGRGKEAMQEMFKQKMQG